MKEVLKYLNECGVFYLATVEADQPRVRPFGAVCAFEEKLYIVTSNEKRFMSRLKATQRSKSVACQLEHGSG